MDLFDKCSSRVKEVEEALTIGIYPYFTPVESAQDRRVRIMGRELVLIGSNSYLGLANDPRMKEAAIEAVKKYGTTCSGSRFLNGTLDIHVKLEQELAEFFEKEACIAFSTGFQTNLGLISAIAGKDDIIYIDRENHASIVDGCRLSFAEVKKFRHNDVKDLERIIAQAPANRAKVIIVDGVFSMEGDLSPLPDYVAIKKRYDARLILDDAHGIGVMGERGRGTAEHFGVLKDVDLIMGTFSKSFGALGGFVVGPRDPIVYIKHTARSLIFSASMVPASVAAARKALEIIKTEPERRSRLWATTHRMLKAYKEMGFNTGSSATPVIPIIIGDDTRTFMFWKALFEHGVFANPVRSPAVPPKRSLIRTSYMATHTKEDMDFVLEVFEKAGKGLGIIK